MPLVDLSGNAAEVVHQVRHAYDLRPARRLDLDLRATSGDLDDDLHVDLDLHGDLHVVQVLDFSVSRRSSLPHTQSLALSPRALDPVAWRSAGSGFGEEEAGRARIW